MAARYCYMATGLTLRSRYRYPNAAAEFRLACHRHGPRQQRLGDSRGEVRAGLARFVIAISCVAFVGGGRAQSQVPDESQLPNVATPQVIPDEGQLPAATSPPGKEVPDEATLPGIAPGSNDEPANETQRESSFSPGSLRPWLRLRFDGHTGIIRSLALAGNGEHMVSAGEDKDLHVWSRQAQEAVASNWFHRRVIRWQVERGPRGRIYATASQGSLVAIAGHGAMGGLGEIWIVDTRNGNLVRSLVDVNRGHRQVIASLAWQPPAPATPAADGAEGAVQTNASATSLASVDVEGRVILWTPDKTTGIWNPRTIVAPDVETYGAALATALASRRRFVPITFLGPDQLLMPRYVGPAAEPAGAARWQLQRFNLTTGKSDVLKVDHIEMVTCMAVSDDQKRLATGDASGRIWHWAFDDNSKLISTKSIEPPRSVALSMDFAKNGTRLLVGTAAEAATKGGEPRGTLEWFDTTDAALVPKKLSSLAMPTHAWGCAFDARASQAIVVDANRLVVHDLTNDQISNVAKQTLAPPVGPVQRVAFSSEVLPYRIAIESKMDREGAQTRRQVFDLSAVRLEPVVENANAAANQVPWIDPVAARGNWTIRAGADELGAGYFVYEGDVKRDRLPLKGELHGSITSEAWFDEPAGSESANSVARKAVVVGSDGRNNLYVYETPAGGKAVLRRQFRGHTGTVLSVGVSQDRRYLVSGSDDATVCIWKLEDLFTADELTNRWGATFEIRGDRLFALDVRRDGPLYFRGVRAGDQLVNIGWIAGLETKAASDAATMLTELGKTEFDALVMFQFARLGRPREPFQSFPAWQPVSTLFVDRTREWAIWTPSGFYDASFGGNELFGWQVNRGVSALPEYFRAAQFRERLERPAALRRLMAAGDLTTAMEDGVSGIAPPPGEGAIVNQFLNKPTIRLLKPATDSPITQGEVEVEAEIFVPRGSVLEAPKAFAGGVPAINRKLIRHEEVGERERYLYHWTSRLPSDRRITLEVIAATDSGATDRFSVDLDNASPVPTRQPHMYFLALGVSNYADPQIQKLDFAARGASVMAELFAVQTRGLYRTTISQLTDQDAIRPLWRDYAAQAARELSVDVGPDDLVVMYLCGHGLRDRRTNQWYFVTADARYNDLMNDRYDDLLSFDDLAMLGELPCRKLAIIDSCHSGAVQPVMRNDDLKAAMRMLQGDVVLTMTASEGEEEAAEQKDRQLGRFTSHLVDALQGNGDGDKDGIVTLRETIEHVIKASEEDSRTSGFVQHPTAGPADLLKSLELPLTRRK